MRVPTAARALLAAALLLSVMALGVGFATRRVAAPAGAFVHVRWAPHVDAARRQELERRFRLTKPEQTEGSTYSYLLTDISTPNIRGLITHPDVVDTQDVDRSAFTLSSTAERVILYSTAQRRLDRFGLAASVLWTGAAALGALAIWFAAAPASRQRLAARLRAGALWLGRAVYSRIPEVSAEGAALFRILFGAALIVVFALSPIGAGDVPPGPQADDTTWLMRMAGDVFIASPHLADGIGPWLSISGALFVAGALTRWSFAAFTGGAMAWGVVHSLRYGHHPVSALLIALLCLLPSRWGDAWSIDAWLRRPSRASPRDYGYTVWIPGVVLGIALAAAAALKLRVGGIGWILNGTVKYHFLTDAANAPVDWGLRFGLVPSVAVALSFGTVAVESLVLPAALVGPWIVRAIAALAVASILAGFWLCLGVFWPAWWILLLSFAPWHLVLPSRRQLAEAQSPSRRPFALRHVQAALLVMAFGQQLIVSVRRLEVPPLFSAYDMYSTTYVTPQEYPVTGGASYWLVATMADGTTDSCQIGRDEIDMFASLPDSGRTQAVDQMLASCFGRQRPIRSLVVENRRPNVDWAAGRYLGTIRVPVGRPVVLAGDEPH